jgi:Condensation domain
MRALKVAHKTLEMEFLSLRIDRAPSLPRTLDSFEEFFWHLEQILPYSPVFAVELEGSVDTATWPERLRAVQSRYPLLRARIRKIPGTRPSFETVEGASIPFERVPLEKDDHVEAAMERSLAIGFGDGSRGLTRVTLLHASDRAILLLSAHHAAFDGRSMMMIIEDLLRAVSGEPLGAAFDGAMDLRQLLSLPENAGYRTLREDFSAAEAVVVADVHVEKVLLSQSVTASVLSSCKSHGVNVRALVAAAMAEAGREDRAEWRSRPLACVSPIDLRPIAGKGDTPGLLIGVSSAAIPPTGPGTLWETAAVIGRAFQQAANVEAQRLQSMRLRQLLEEEHLPDTFAKAWRSSVPTPDIMINNYGPLAIRDTYRDFRIKTISSCSIAALGLTQKVSMSSLHGQMGLCVATRQPIHGILEKTSAILARASSH